MPSAEIQKGKEEGKTEKKGRKIKLTVPALMKFIIL